MIDFKAEFETAINRAFENGLEWELVGILTKNSSVYTLSYDSKILSGIFEILCEPLIVQIAKKFNLKVDKAKQNQYPEFTLYDPAMEKEKIAIDIKSTYRQYTPNGALKPFGFTLGSYRSYLRDPKKGILFPYGEYKKHWVVGFLYTRNVDSKTTEIRKVIEASQLLPPFTNIEYFVQEKYKVAGRTPGSGNTTNIGSIKSNDINVFREGKSGFHTLIEFEKFWKKYRGNNE